MLVNPLQEILRVVIDTNHIMSAILSARGASAKLIDWMTREEDYFRLLMSPPIWNEYRTVADWLIPESQQREKARILNILRLQSDWIEPKIQLNVCRDESDNRFLECAVEGKADYLVTKNIRHFPPKKYQGVNIVRIRKFLDVLERLQKAHS
ncbi:putative toxin-antitoxin system toxin component, PIN family [Candidatus Poribacteria bacterium]|nr:putative toxin-antitoxin system toxin component, PIN family [Candidatus Poribacteria bacterium]